MKGMNILKNANNLQKTLKKKEMIKPNDSVLVTISGGQDSIFLSFLLYLLQNQIAFQFGFVWCHHFWQKGSFFTMLHLAKFNFSFFSQIVFFLPLRPVLSEQGARHWRHSILHRAFLFYHYDLCTQGHTKSDRVETVFFNLIRGAGLSGISSLQWSCQKFLSTHNKFYATVSEFSQNFYNLPCQKRNKNLKKLSLTKTQYMNQIVKKSNLTTVKIVSSHEFISQVHYFLHPKKKSLKRSLKPFSLR